MVDSKQRICRIFSDPFDLKLWSLSGHMTEHFVSEEVLAVTTA